MKMTGAIFDMDGTLLDSMPIWDRVGIDYLAGLGIQARPDLPERLLTMSMRQAAAYFRSGYGVNLPEAEIMDGINARIEAFYRKTAPAKEGVRVFARASAIGCENVRGNGDRPPFGQKPALRRTGLLSYFSFLLTCTEAGFGKDSPDIFVLAQKKLGTPREQTVVFEDALYAMQTAKRAGFPVAAVYDASSQADQEQIRQLADVYMPLFPGAEEALL